MRALIIGIGGAGCRITELMNQHDKKSKIPSIRAFIFDSDKSILKNKSSIDEDHRITLSPYDLSGELDESKLESGKDFDVSCIATVFQDSAVDEVDAIFVCAGLGGRMAEAVPDIINQLNQAFSDPVFAILTLPARSEGVRVSARAAQELEEIRKVCSSSIIFDNETWIQRLEEVRASDEAREKEKEGEGEIIARQSLKLPIKEQYNKLNELLVRRIELLIFAGEITEKGVEVAEAVLDAGEVLNTLKDTDLVSIGYASTTLPPTPRGIFKFFSPAEKENPLDTKTERTARIVELAKRAVYEEVSIPCDLTSANRALILITGPSEELSMKGFQTIRKWIDRSIRGLEMRAGDYPIHAVRNVAVVIVLAGIENIPRIDELNSIRDSYQEEIQKVYPSPKKAGIEVKHLEEAVDDNDIFEEAAYLMGTERPSLPAPASITASTDDDDFWLDSSPSLEDTGGDDVFEEDVVVQPTTTPINTHPSIERPAVATASAIAVAPVIIKKEERIEPTPVSPAASDFDPFDAEIPKAVKEVKRAKDPQISLGGAKKAVKKEEAEFFLPKREKKEDMVLHGLAEVGGHDKPKDVESISRIGSAMRPREVEGTVSFGGRQRPRDSDSGVSIGLRQRPKEIGGTVQISSAQRPKEIDGAVHISSAQRPKEIDGAVHISSAQRPKEIGGAVHISSAQRPKEIDGAAVHLATAQKPKEIDGAVRISSAQRPKEIGNDVHLASAQRPREIGNNLRVATAQKPKEFGNDVHLASAQRPREIGNNLKVGTAQKPKEIGNDIRVLPGDKKKEEDSNVKAGSKPTEDKYAEKRGFKWV